MKKLSFQPMSSVPSSSAHACAMAQAGQRTGQSLRGACALRPASGNRAPATRRARSPVFVGQQRQALQRGDGLRQHGRAARAQEVVAALAGGGSDSAEHHCRRCPARASPGCSSCTRHRVRDRRCLDAASISPGSMGAAQLDLPVEAAEVLRDAGQRARRRVAGAIAQRAGRSLGSAAKRSALISAAAGSPAPRHGPPMTISPAMPGGRAGGFVEHGHRGGGDRRADGDRRGRVGDARAGRPDRGLGRPVHVPELADARQQARRQIRRQRSPPISARNSPLLAQPAASSSMRQVEGVACIADAVFGALAPGSAAASSACSAEASTCARRARHQRSAKARRCRRTRGHRSGGGRSRSRPGSARHAAQADDRTVRHHHALGPAGRA